MVAIDMGQLPEEDDKFYLVTSEDEKAGAEMSAYLISQGVKRIVYLANAGVLIRMLIIFELLFVNAFSPSLGI